MIVNTLVTGFRIFREVKATDERTLGIKLRSIIFVLIESGMMALFSIQLASIVVIEPIHASAYRAYWLIAPPHQMLNVIIDHCYFSLY
jgi:hypothetical protein